MVEKEKPSEHKTLSFSPQEFARRFRKVREIMQLRGIDGLIITGNTGYNSSLAADIRYITGLSGLAAEGTYVLFPLI
jgi:hypothetical protein